MYFTRYDNSLVKFIFSLVQFYQAIARFLFEIIYIKYKFLNQLLYNKKRRYSCVKEIYNSI